MQKYPLERENRGQTTFGKHKQNICLIKMAVKASNLPSEGNSHPSRHLPHETTMRALQRQLRNAE